MSDGEPVRATLRVASEAVGLRAVMVTVPSPNGEVVLCSSTVEVESVREGWLLPDALDGLDEQSLPIIDPGGGHVAGELRWIRGGSRSELDQSELQTLSLCAQAVATAPAAGSGASPAAAVEGPASNVMRLLAALATRSVKGAWEVDRVIQLSESVARELHLPEPAVTEVVQLAMLREIGNLGIPARVLEKRGLLSRSEYRLLREQPILGERIVAAMPDLAHLAPLIRASQEQWDGSGYPDGLAGEEIPLQSRIVNVCNAFVAMLCERPFRKALPRETATMIVDEKSGSQFCPISVAGLEKVLEVESRADSAARAGHVERHEPEPEHRAEGESAPKREPAKLVPPAGRAERPRTQSSARAALARDRTPDRAMRILYPLGLVFGTALGVVIALPIDSAEGRCPPPGEARTQCILQKVWLHELTVVFVVVLATMLVGYLAFFKLPDVFRRWRRGELFATGRRLPFPTTPSCSLRPGGGAGFGLAQPPSPTRGDPAKTAGNSGVRRSPDRTKMDFGMIDREVGSGAVVASRRSAPVRALEGLMLACVGVMVVATAFDAAGEPLVAIWIYNATSVCAAALCLLRARLVTEQRLAWALFGVSILTWAVGDLLWAALVEGVDRPAYPGWSDLFYLVFYPLAMVALALLSSSVAWRGPGPMARSGRSRLRPCSR